MVGNELYFGKSIEIEKIRSIQLDLAEEVKRICNKYDIKYFIIWGTLLGAVRNKGFIPWDDDFDLALFREDYEKFISVAKDELTAPFFLQTALSDELFFLPYARLRNSNTTGIIVDNYSPDYNNGIFIDIYPLDAIPTNTKLRNIKYEARDLLCTICNNYNYIKKGGKSPLFEKIVVNLLSYKSICGLFFKICQIGNKKDNSIVGLAYHKRLSKTYKFNSQDAFETVEIEFENRLFSAPKEYQTLLNEVYGDYMKLPPKRKRGRWHEGQIIYDPNISYKEYMNYKNEKI